MQALSPANEDYLKAIYGLRSRGQQVTIGQLASELKVSSPSVTGMVKRLEAGKLVSRPDPRSLRLTAKGELEALRVVRRHRLLETFLFTVLDVPWEEVHDEAERLEHVLSDRLENRIDAHLGHPSHDPHGDPTRPGPVGTSSAGASGWTPLPRAPTSSSSGCPTGTVPHCATSASSAYAPVRGCGSRNRRRSGDHAGSGSKAASGSRSAPR